MSGDILILALAVFCFGAAFGMIFALLLALRMKVLS